MTLVISSETRDHLPSTQDGVNLPQYPIGLASADLGLGMKRPSRVTEAKFPKSEVFLEAGECSLKEEARGPPHYLFTVKFSNPKISRRPMDRREFFTSREGGL